MLNIYRVHGPSGMANINQGDARALVSIGILVDVNQEDHGNGIVVNNLRPAGD